MRSAGALSDPRQHASMRVVREQDSHAPAHSMVMNEITAAVEEHAPSFTRVETDLLRCPAGTILRYNGTHETSAIILPAGFEVTSDGFPVQRWDYTDTVGREHAATQAAQFVANRLVSCLCAA